MVQVSAVKPTQCTRGVSKEYHSDEFEPLFAPTFSASARLRRTNCSNLPPPCVPYASWLLQGGAAFRSYSEALGLHARADSPRDSHVGHSGCKLHAGRVSERSMHAELY